MIRFIYYFHKTLTTVLPFLSFKSLSHAYLGKTSMTHNKYLILLFFEENNPISGKSAAQILSLNLQLVVHLHLFLILYSHQKSYGSYLLTLFDIYHS